MVRPAIIFTNKGDFSKTFKWLHNHANGMWLKSLERYGQMGVDALRAATPVDTGLTADSWSYRIDIEERYHRISIVWCNSHVEKGYANIAILLQFGHATRGGGYVVGRDYINPAMRPVFDSIAKSAWEELTKD